MRKPIYDQAIFPPDKDVPNELWFLLQTFAKHNGTVSRKKLIEEIKTEFSPEIGESLEIYENRLDYIVTDRVMRLGEHLCKFFGIAGGPIIYDKETDSYKTLFKCECEPEINTSQENLKP